jgi:hypothetical protein
MVELSGYSPINLICLGLLGALLLRRLVRMERFHWPRVVLLTVLLWVPALYLFSLPFPESPGCVVPLQEEDFYTCTEM